MAKMMVRILPLAVLLTGFALALGQDTPRTGKDEKTPPAPLKEPAAKEKSRLEEWLDQALKNNPDIRVAEAKVQEAEAVLNRTRLQVVQKVATHYHEWVAQKSVVDYREAAWKRVHALRERSTVSAEVEDEARKALEEAKAKLAAIEAERPYLTGKQPASKANEEAVKQGLNFLNRNNYDQLSSTQFSILNLTQGAALAALETRGPMAARIRKGLDKPVPLDYKDKPAAEVLDDLFKKAEGIPIHVQARLDRKITLQSKEPLPLGAALQMFQDFTDPGLRFVVRDYGILVTHANFLPEGAVLLHDFWKRGAKETTAESVSEQEHYARELKARELLRGGASPENGVDGTIKAVDKESGLVKITFGKGTVDRGILLHVFRLSSEPGQSRYLGRVRVIDVKDKEAVAEPMGRLQSAIQIGDRVAEHILGN